MKNEEKNEIVANVVSRLLILLGMMKMSCKKNVDFAKIYKELLVCDKCMSSDMDGALPNLCTNSTVVSNSSNSANSRKDFIEISSLDDELVSILEDLQHNKMPENINFSNHIQGYFCSDSF